MKKSLVALAALAVVGGASAQVTISGIMDAYVGNGNNYGQKYSVLGQSGARTTTFKFEGKEALGSGMAAKFRFEVQPQFVAGDGNAYNTLVGIASLPSNTSTTTSTTINGGSTATTGGFALQSGLTGKGESYIALEAGGFDIRLGTNNTHHINTQVNGSGAFGTGIGSGYGVTFGSTSTNTVTRFEESVKIITPAVGGVNLSLVKNLKNNSVYGSTTGGITLRRPDVTEYGIEYKNGPLQLDAAQLSVKGSPNELVTPFASSAASNDFTPLASNVTTKTTSWSASYDLGTARLGFNQSSVKNDAGNVLTYASATSNPVGTVAGNTNTKSNMAFVQIPFGASRVLIGSGQLKVNASPVSDLIGGKLNLTGFAYEYDLSKRTYLYLRYQGGTSTATNAATTYVNGQLQNGNSNGPMAGKVLATTTFNLAGVGISHAF